MIPFLMQKPRSSASISGTCRVSGKGKTESDSIKTVPVVTVKTKEKNYASIISNSK